MSKEYKINKGDRVRFVGEYDHYVEDCLKAGNEYTVVDADMCGCDAVRCTADSVNGEDLELVEPYDRSTTFLTRLQSLLREFDAEIVFHCDYKQETLSTSIIVGESELRRNEVYGFTADNIMDFDK
ncbi:MAG: hypothetical protein HDS08_00590 [Bacteroides sp.]|nr:hypothetical protein [Bacteroides sp.]